MHASQRRVRSTWSFLVGLMLLAGGCSFFSGGEEALKPSIVEKENGFLLELPGSKGVAGVDALVTRQRWVIVTIVDPLYDLAPIQQFSSVHVDSLELTRFTSAVQLSLRFRQDIGEAYVVSQPADPSILISVFSR